MALLTPNILPSQTYPFGPATGKTGLRYMLAQLVRQEGVLGSQSGGGDYKASQRAAGANMSVDVAPGDAWINGEDTARQGSYHQHNDATINVAVPANASGSPRFDQVVLRIYDSSISGVSDTPAIEVLPGTPNGSATIDNRLGAAALPNGALRLAEWVTPNGAANIGNAIIRDRRPWSRGAYARIMRTAGDYTSASTAIINIDSVNLAPRVECSGAPLRMSLRGRARNNTANTYIGFGFSVDATLIDGISATDYGGHNSLAAGQIPVAYQWDTIPSPGSRVVTPYWQQGAGTGTLEATAGFPLELVVEELTRQNAQNAGL